MKKVSKYFLFVFGLLALLTIKAQAVNAATLHMENTQYFYDRSHADGSNRHSWYWKHYTMDNEVSYCIEPNVPEGKTYNQGSYSDTGLPDSIKERLLLIGYYGYTYPGHNTEKYRAATQGLLWDTIIENGANTIFTTARWGKGTLFDVSAEKAEINRLIAHHYDRPSFNAGVYKLQVGQSLTLTDTNDVLSQYNISVSNATYSVDGNKLTITPTNAGTINLIMTKKQVYNSSYKLFVGDGIQNMLVPGTVDPVVAEIKINSYYTSVEVLKKDKETNTSQGQATLKGATYGVYEQATGKLITTITTDENGYAKSDSVLSYNQYYLQEIKASDGYLLDNTRYNFDVRGKESAKVEVFETVVENYISILKQYEYVDGNTTFLNAEKDITFEIYYPNGDLFDTITTDKNGYATLNIPYGVWKFHQVNTTTGFEKIYDFYITVDYNSLKEQYYNILNNSLTAYLQVFKTDSETGKTIGLANTTFKIYNKDTKQYVSQYVGGKVYSEFKTNEDGVFVTYLKLVAGNYKLIEVTSPKGYLLDTNGIDFTIGEDTHYAYTTYGAFITMYYKNSPIKAQIEIKKTGEVFIVQDGTFNYNSKTSLKGIVYNIYADSDIKSSDGNFLYYNSGDLVETITTDDKGYAISKKLPLGKYKVVEVKTQEDYVLDETEHFIELIEKDNKTAVVYSKLELTNYLKKANVEITKTDLITGDAIPNTILEIYTENDELIFTGTTDKDGKIIIDKLKLGKYYFVEKEASTGYIITDEKVYFELKENGEVAKANMTNKKITSTLKITKMDEDDKKLSGVKFGIYDLEDNLIKEVITDDNGLIEIELEYGKYYFKEISTLNEYVVSDEKIYFEVKDNGAIIEEKVVNEYIKGAVEITKIDISTSSPLPNTLIEVYNNKDELVYSGRTNEEGKIIIEELRYGKYYFLEKEAPEGYKINTEKLYFEVLEDGEIIKCTMKDEKVVVEVPNTLRYDYMPFVILGVTIIGLGAVIYGIKKSKKSKNK